MDVRKISILEFFKPEYFKISISLFSNNFMKNSCVVINNINGNIWKIISGEFKNDNIIGKYVSTFKSLKNSSSDNKFKINTKLKIIPVTKSKDVKKIFSKYLI